MLPIQLCHFSRDAYILAHYSEAPDGRDFEAAISAIAHLLGFAGHQGPGSLSLFGNRSASGCHHELDLGIANPGFIAMAEVKSISGGISKNDVMIFTQKTFDYYVWRLRERRNCYTWRFFISSTPVPGSVHTYCIQQGVILVEPSVLPLPVLLRFVKQPQAEDVFDDSRLAEAVRLFEPACFPLERIYVPKIDHLKIGISRFTNSDADDARWLASEMTRELLESITERGDDPLWNRAKLLARSGAQALSRVIPCVNVR